MLAALPGGWLADRFPARSLLLTAELMRGGSILLLGLLAASAQLTVWQAAVLMVPLGCGLMLFNPAAFALLPRLVPSHELSAANAVRVTIRTLMGTLIGPAAGGALVALAGPASALLVSALCFALSALALTALLLPPSAPDPSPPPSRLLSEATGGLRLLWQTPWLLIALASGTLTFFLFDGPLHVLLPFRVKNDLQAGADGLGLIYASGGAAAALTGVIVAQLARPHRLVTVMYWTYAASILALGLYGLAESIWQAIVASIAFNALLAVAEVYWTTLLQLAVPRQLLGRVASLDWIFSTALSPFSYLLTAPAAEHFGARATLLGAGILGCVVTLALWALPAARTPERPPGPRPACGPRLSEPPQRERRPEGTRSEDQGDQKKRGTEPKERRDG
ncbi:MAG: tetracycline efflux MFS transporter Tet(V) [Dehalococcoidia bacterium]|nr:MAG: tetracycline efflux MFS transporter Tet(V) [Dehalococcoidia bacterium]